MYVVPNVRNIIRTISEIDHQSFLISSQMHLLISYDTQVTDSNGNSQKIKHCNTVPSKDRYLTVTFGGMTVEKY